MALSENGTREPFLVSFLRARSRDERKFQAELAERAAMLGLS